LSPHLHPEPALRDVKWIPGAIPGQLMPANCPDPWGQEKYEVDLAAMSSQAAAIEPAS